MLRLAHDIAKRLAAGKLHAAILTWRLLFPDPLSPPPSKDPAEYRPARRGRFRLRLGNRCPFDSRLFRNDYDCLDRLVAGRCRALARSGGVHLGRL